MSKTHDTIIEAQFWSFDEVFRFIVKKTRIPYLEISKYVILCIFNGDHLVEGIHEVGEF